MIQSLEGLVIGETRVKSLNTGSTGTISGIRSEARKESRFDSIDINWDNGKFSSVFLINSEYIELV